MGLWERLPRFTRRISWRRLLLPGLAAGAAGGGLAVFVLFGPPRLLAYSESPEFCVKCHNHEVEGEAFIHSGAHRRKLCVDCHLPNRNLPEHFLWKGVDGLHDVALFYAGMFTDDTRLTRHGRQVLQANCVRCHETTVMRIDHDRPCWECHRRVAHKGAAPARSF